jgi:alpha-L-fucosidase 2
MECSGSDDGEWVWVRLPTLAEAVEAAATEQQKSPSAAEMEEEERPLKVVFASPAEYFTDAAPIGNGSLGGMVWGGVATEKLQLNRN